MRIKLEADTQDVEARQSRREELEKKYPGGAAWIQPICDYVEDPGVDRPRREDHYKPRLTHIKIPVSTQRGTHPHTGMPKIDERYVTVNLIDPVMKWPVDVRTDMIPGLSKKIMDPYELLEFLEDFPVCGIHYKLIPIDPILDERISKASRTRGAKTLLRDVMNGANEKSRPAEGIPQAANKPRRVTGVTMDDEVPDMEEAAA